MQISTSFKQLFSFSVRKAVVFMLLVPTITFISTSPVLYRYLIHTEEDVLFTNIAGKQRMIAAQMKTFAHMIHEMGVETRKDSLQDLIATFNRNLVLLDHGGFIDGHVLPPASSEIRESIRQVRQLWQNTEKSFQVMIKMPRDDVQAIEAYSYIKSNIPKLIKLSDNVVQSYQQLSSKQYMHLISFWSTAFVLNIIFLFLGLAIIIRYISEQKEVEKSLREAEKKYRSIFENINEGIYQTTPDGDIFILNQRMAEIFGYHSPQEMLDSISTVIQLFVHPDRRKDFIQQLGKEGSVTEFVSQFYKKDGSIIWVSENAHILKNDNGEIVGYEGSMTEITDRIIAQQTLKESEERFKTIIESAPDGMVIINQKGQIVQVNTQAEKLFGYTRKELIGQSFEILIPTRFKEHGTYQKGFFDNPRARRMGTGLEIYGLRKDGSEFPIDAKLSHFNSPEGVLVSVSVRDITEIREAIKSLREEEELNRLVLNNVDEIIYMVKMDKKDPVNGKIIFVSERALNITGYSNTEFLKNPSLWFDLIHPDDKIIISRSTQDIVSTGESGVREYRLKHKDGNYRWFSDHVVPQKEDGKVISLFGVARDITKQKEKEEEQKLLEIQVRQKQKLESIGVMAGGIAHDFNNILQGIFLYSGILKDKLADDESIRSSFQHILDAGDRAKNLVRQILTFSKSEAHEHEPIKLQDILDSTLPLIRASIPTTIAIETDIDKECPSVLGDETQVHQIIVNLCNNAGHAMEEQGGVLEVILRQVDSSSNKAVQLSDIEDGNFIELLVRDTGTGMSPEVKEKIFDPFFSTKEPDKGTGLGLSMVYGIVKDMNGQITVDSEPGKGSTFRIHLPVLKDVDSENKSEERQAILPKDKTLLFVTSEQAVTEAARIILEEKGFTVYTADDGLSAQKTFTENPTIFDLIISDLTMPKMSGVELTEEIRKVSPDIPILMMSGSFDVNLKEKLYNLGISGFIRKPWTPEDLFKSIAKIGLS